MCWLLSGYGIKENTPVIDGYTFDCQSYFTGTTAGLISTSGQTGVSTGPITMSVPWANFNAMSIQVRFQATDIPHTGGPTTAAHGLSTGAKAGIGVGVAIAALLVFVSLGIWILWRRKRQLHSRSPRIEHEEPDKLEQSGPQKGLLYPEFKLELEGEFSNWKIILRLLIWVGSQVDAPGPHNVTNGIVPVNVPNHEESSRKLQVSRPSGDLLEEQNSISSIQNQIQKVKEERERLERLEKIAELTKQQEELEQELASK
jgi:hypothetical protein